MAQRLGHPRDEVGQAGTAVVAVVTLVTLVLAGVLVNRVAWTAESINKKAGNIAKTAVPINRDTDAVLNLDTTNGLAGSILETARPLEGKLAEIIRLAKSVDGLATSINGSASEVDGTARGINSTAAGILETARSIDRGVAQINANLDTTIALAQQIKGDSGNILGQARFAHREAACIDQGLGGGALSDAVRDGHCNSKPRA